LYATHRNDDVTRADAGCSGRTVLQHASDDHAAFGGQVEGLDHFARQILRLDADPATGDLTVLENTLEHLLCSRDRNGKADAHGAARTGKNSGVDA
jgi:hypothetical protein